MSGNVSHQQSDSILSGSDIVVKVPAQLGGRQVAGGNGNTSYLALLGREHALLEGASFGQLLLQPFEMALVLFFQSPQIETSLDQSLQDLAVKWFLQEVEGLLS